MILKFVVVEKKEEVVDDRENCCKYTKDEEWPRPAHLIVEAVEASRNKVDIVNIPPHISLTVNVARDV